MIYFVATTEETMAKEQIRLFQNNMWKLHELPESTVSDRGPQFVAEIMKKLNKILEIEIISFHLQTDRQIERMNQKLEQYL